MAYVAPITWATSTDITAARLNQDVRDNVSFLANAPCCRVYNSANLSISDATETTVTFNSERFDTDTMHSTSVNTGRITMTTAGVYLVTFTGFFAAGSDYNSAYAVLRADGATQIAISGTQQTAVSIQPFLSVSAIWKFTAGQYVEARVYHDNAANAARNLQASASGSAEFAACWQAIG